MLDVITAEDARQWAAASRALLAVHRAEIDRLNVYPVPDGDTGTNLYLTFDAAVDAVEYAQERAGTHGHTTLVQELEAMAGATLLSARGNSGVILSQLVRGFADAVVASDAEEMDAVLLAAASRRASERAYASVTHPVEGTVLTVSREVAQAAQDAVATGSDLRGTAEAMLRAAEQSLAATTGTLPALAAAGVVDAGAAGYLLLVEGLHRIVTGESALRRPGTLLTTDAGHRGDTWSGRSAGLPEPTPHAGATAGGEQVTDGEGLGPAYEVMFLLDGTSEAAVGELTDRLDALGDSLLVVGGPQLWNVHVHVDDAGAAIEAGIEAGRPHRIRVTHLGTQVAERDVVVEVAVVACAAGPGISTLMEAAGAVVVPSGPGRRASTGQLLEAVRDAHAHGVLLLPNDSDTVLSARAAAQAARDEGLVVHVVPARTVVQGLAALAVFDPGQSAEDNAVAMAEAAAGTRHGGVTIAAKEGLTSAGHCQPGDVLGIVGGDFAVIGDDLRTVANDVLGQLLAAGGELVTLVAGADAPPDLADAVAAEVAARHHRVEIVHVDGGQPHYPLLVGVE